MRPIARLPILALAFLALAVAPVSVPAWAARKPVYSSIVVDANTGEVLHAVSPDAKTYPASTAKIMTVYLLFEAMARGKLRMDTMLRVSDAAAAQAPSKLGLDAGKTVSVRDAMLAVVTKSANDMSVVLAEAIAGSEPAFAERMTAKAKTIGMRNTRFKNASGLPDPEQVTTARDLATLGMAVLREYPRQYQVFATHDFSYDGYVHPNHNKLLGRYAGLDGIKTGYIRASGFNLVASAERGGRRLVAVVLGGNAPGWRDKHMAQLLDTAFRKRPAVMLASADKAKPTATNGAPATAPPAAPPIAKEIQQRPGAAAPEPVIATDEPPPPAPVYAEESDSDEPTIADMISDDAAEEIALSGDWGVQVGAFKLAHNAQRAADEARRFLPANLAGAKSVVDEKTVRRAKVFQARLVGMSEGEARALCKTMKKKKADCLAVPPPVPGVKEPA
ncbi:MAG: D-alanyl-D-alanine carboxypeptidase family protein [Rhodospirillales bacterium]